MLKNLEAYLKDCISRFNSIEPNRRQLLTAIADYLKATLSAGDTPRLVFICTHNSRRSQFGQVWAKVAAHYYQLHSVETYSGGTEATAFSVQAIASLQRAGLEIEPGIGINPMYLLRYGTENPSIQCFSKVFDHEINPKSNFIALMTCDHADGLCPFIPGASRRFSLTYKDPKEADGTTIEESIYDSRCLQIATEMMFLMKTTADHLAS